MNYLGLAGLILCAAGVLWYSEKMRRTPLKKVRKPHTFRVINGGKTK